MTAPLADIAPSEKLPGHEASLGELDRRLGREDLTLVAGPDAVWTGPRVIPSDTGLVERIPRFEGTFA